MPARSRHPLPRQLGLALDLPIEHYDLLHQQQRGVVIHWERGASLSDRWIKLRPGDPRIPEIFRVDRGKDDTFITVNEFDGWVYIRLLRSLRALYVDLDDQTDVYAVLDALDDARIPWPSIVVSSGTGLHLYWLLEPLPPKTLPVWQRCQDALIRLLKPLGADVVAKDCTRLLRLVGTRNRGEEVRALVLDGHRWSLRQIAFEILGTEGRGRKPCAEIRDIRARRPRPDKAIQGSIYARWHLVYQDIRSIAAYHNHAIPEGYRDKWLFLASVALSWFTHPQGIADEILGLGQDNTDLLERDIHHAYEPALKRAIQAAAGETILWQGKEVDPRYRFRRQTLYDWLDGLIPDALLPQLRAIVPDRVRGTREKQRLAAIEKTRNRAKEGRYGTSYTQTGVRACNVEKCAQARSMREQGATYRQIAAAVGISHETVRKWCATGVN
ncbi:replication protein [Acidithiobacillus ferrooxidans]|uniref:replication protein n=1 Tax=Acidithiobacillus ferridurans TaxID=1232575 RepID=UPI001C06CABC|nr:replication protein [Acidithiobacillus ferridurans]MBU2805395.1 replication protein [Acidithiobacillus ferridurans]MBU2824398.1 replication protein [Acidithiobacillus ferrooxidans]